MGRLWDWLAARLSRDAESTSTRRRSRLETHAQFEGLEDRKLCYTDEFLLRHGPAVLYPANGQYVSVNFVGFISTTHQKVVPKANFYVTDQYRQYEPHGPVTLKLNVPGNYEYDFNVLFPAKHNAQQGDNRGRNNNSRQFNLVVVGRDSDNSVARTARVLVPASNYNPNGPNPKGSGR